MLCKLNYSLAALVVCSMHSMAAADPDAVITCENYSSSVLIPGLTEYASGIPELDCSEDAQAKGLWVPKLGHRVYPTAQETHDAQRVESPLLDALDFFQSVSTAELERRFFPLRSELTEFWTAEDRFYGEYDQNIREFALLHMPRMLGLSVQENLELADGRACLPEERGSEFMAGTVRQWHHTINPAHTYEHWLIGPCQGQGSMWVTKKKNADGTEVWTKRPLPERDALKPEFTHFDGSQPYPIFRSLGLSGLSIDGQTSVFKWLEVNSNAYLDAEDHYASQLELLIIRGDQVHRLPSQKMINLEYWPKVKLSHDGRQVLIASLYHVKLYVLDAETQTYVLRGHYQHEGEALMPEGVHFVADSSFVALRLDDVWHSLEFIPTSGAETEPEASKD
jgi:hypothetical protein